jgi:hypothetical protein
VISDPLPGTGQFGCCRGRVRQDCLAMSVLGCSSHSLQRSIMPHRCATPAVRVRKAQNNYNSGFQLPLSRDG